MLYLLYGAGQTSAGLLAEILLQRSQANQTRAVLESEARTFQLIARNDLFIIEARLAQSRTRKEHGNADIIQQI